MAARVSTGPAESNIRPIRYEEGRVLLLDQRKLPEKEEYYDATELDAMCFAIKDMVVRGAPAIGVAAAFGLASEAKRAATFAASWTEFLEIITRAKERLQETRPTAVNLRWGLESIMGIAEANKEKPLVELAEIAFDRARSMVEEDIFINMAMSDYGAELLGAKANILTHCNAGALASCGWGMALGVVRAAVRRGVDVTVFVDETRPRQQGARLTAWELLQDCITPTLITDNMAGYLMGKGDIDTVIVGADRIAANGDTANKIGTYSVAVLAHAHDIPFYVAAPPSTIDPSIGSGADIPIEERDPLEVTRIGGTDIAPPGCRVINPGFDVTPARLITAIITEVGVLRPPFAEAIQRVLAL